MKLSLFFLFLLISLFGVSAVSEYQDCNVYGVCKPTTTSTSVSYNFSEQNVNDSLYLRGLTPQQVANLNNLSINNNTDGGYKAILQDLIVKGTTPTRNLSYIHKDANNNYLTIGGAIETGLIGGSSVLYANDTGATDNLAICSKGTGSSVVFNFGVTGINCGTNGISIYDGGTTNNVNIKKGAYTDNSGAVTFGTTTSITTGALGVRTVADPLTYVFEALGADSSSSLYTGENALIQTGDGYLSDSSCTSTEGGSLFLTTGTGGYDIGLACGSDGGDIALTTGSSVYGLGGDINLNAGLGVSEKGYVNFLTNSLYGNNIYSYFGATKQSAIYQDGTHFHVNPRATGSGILVVGSNNPSAASNTLMSLTGNAGFGFQEEVFSSTSATDVAYTVISRGRGSYASKSAVTAGDRVGTYAYQGYDGSAMQTSSAILASVDRAVAGGSVPLALEFQTGTSGGTRSSRMIINSTGNVVVTAGNNLTIGSIMQLTPITLPSCTTFMNWSVGANITGIYVCNGSCWGTRAGGCGKTL